MSGPPPGWYPDPDDSAKLAWWNGEGWAEGAPKMLATASAAPAAPVASHAPAQPTTNGGAVVSLVLSLLACLTPAVAAQAGLFLAAIAIAAGAGGLTRAKMAGGKGHGLAVAGIVLGSLAALGNIVIVVGVWRGIY